MIFNTLTITIVTNRPSALLLNDAAYTSCRLSGMTVGILEEKQTLAVEFNSLATTFFPVKINSKETDFRSLDIY